MDSLQPSFYTQVRRVRAIALGIETKTWADRAWMIAWGADIFVNGVPLLKTFTLVNVLLTIGLVTLLR